MYPLYPIYESITQALIMTLLQALYYYFVANKVIRRACIIVIDSEMPYFLIWSLCLKNLVHHAVHCISLSCLFSVLCTPYIPFLIYEIFHLLVSFHFFTAFSSESYRM